MNNQDKIDDLVVASTETNVLMKTFIDEQRRINKRITDKHSQYDEFIYGTSAEDGVKIKIDRLEQRSRLVNWVGGLAITGIILNGVRVVMDHWPGGGQG